MASLISWSAPGCAWAWYDGSVPIRTMLPVTAGDHTLLVSLRKRMWSSVPQYGSGTTMALYLAKSAVVMLYHSSWLAHTCA